MNKIRFVEVWGVAAVVAALLTVSCSLDSYGKPGLMAGGDGPSGSASEPYDLRGLTIDPGANEPLFYAAPDAAEKALATRATASAVLPVAPRMIGEWEPVQGALIRYPLGISVACVKLIASELKVYVLCSSTSQPSARTAFQSGGVNMANVAFITATTDTYWTRDYGPWWIASGTGTPTVYPVDVVYRSGGVRPNDDKVPTVVAAYFGFPAYYPLSFVCQGGNVMTDSRWAGASTDRLLDENSGYPLSTMLEMAKGTLGLAPYYVVSDPTYPADYIKHIDCWAKMISPTKVLVKRVPPSSSDYSKFEAAAAEWANRTNKDGVKYAVIRIDGTDASPYVNHVILNDRVLVPITRSATDATDKKALDQIQAAYGPSYRVVGVLAASNLPWLGTDSIHCRVNSIPVLGALVPPPEPTNLALGKAATGSSSYTGRTPSATVDGDAATYWASASVTSSNATQWLAVDLGASRSVGKVRVKWSATNYAKAWSLQAYVGSTWTTVYSTTSGSSGWNEATFAQASAQKFRVYATSNAASYYTVYEFELY